MGNTQRFLPVLLSSALCFFFVACGGGSDGAMPIIPKAEGNELERIANEMQQGLNNFVGAQVTALTSSAQNGNFDLSLVSALIGGAQSFNSSIVPQKYTQWTGACTNPTILPTLGGLSPAACINSFWHTLASIGMGSVVNPIRQHTTPNQQLATLLQVLPQAAGSGVPGSWLSAGQNAVNTLSAALNIPIGF